MKLVFYSLVLNHHQACVADEFYKLLGENYAFVETARCIDNKGATEDYSARPYLVRSWETKKAYEKAMSLALNAEVCVFSGYEALPFEKARMRKGLLSFDMGERMLKRGWINLASTRIIKMVMAYHLGGWSKKPLYKLCCSAYAASDQYKLKTFQGKCYKWGYFTEVKEIKNDGFKLKSSNDSICIMWCARFLNWKHPELPVKLARRLKDKGYKFQIKMAGSGDLLQKTRKLISKLDVDNCVSLIGNRTNEEILVLMQRSQIFIFTSDQNEGWGAVANESMSNGCVLVASDTIGSTPYLIKEGVTGFSFTSCDVDSMSEKVKWLIEHPHKMQEMQRNAYQQMKDVWNPKHAAESLLTLIKDIQNGQLSSIQEGPCSKA
jgi:glycosyltransferase involved in cell wall biosynthesis